MTNDGYNTLVYDGENRATSATNGSSSGAYAYDGNGIRIKKCVPNCTSPTTTTVYIFSGSKVVAEYVNGAAPTSPTREYLYSGSTLIAKIESSATNYYHQDHLSNRLVTNSSGTVAAQLGHFPFGESWYNATNDKLQFTTYERDAESGNDYAISRNYVNRLSRFSSSEAFGGSIGDIQSHNGYAYITNNPLNLIEPTATQMTDNIYDPSLAIPTFAGTAAVLNPALTPPPPAHKFTPPQKLCTRLSLLTHLNYCQTTIQMPPPPSPLGELLRDIDLLGVSFQSATPPAKTPQDLAAGFFLYPSQTSTAELQNEAAYCAGLALTEANPALAKQCATSIPFRPRKGTLLGVPGTGWGAPDGSGGGGYADICWNNFAITCPGDPIPFKKVN